DFARFRKIADEVGAYLMVDMAHFAGLVAGGAHSNPLEHAHVVTTTTHKTLRGPRGGRILCRGEALRREYKPHPQAVVDNAKVLAATLQESGLDIVSGGTDTHLMLVDLRPKGAKGRDTEKALDRASITTNKNAVPVDTEKPPITSGVRLGR